MRTLKLILAVAVALAIGSGLQAQTKKTSPVTDEMLLKPSPSDWLMFSRTYDAQRFSPLKQITRQNVGQLKEAFKKELGAGVQESIPLVHDGVMYLAMPGAAIQA